MRFEPKGPTRYSHQNRGLTKLIHTKGVGALLFEPGLGKTMTALDFASLLALKADSDPESGVQETRMLVICPLVAVDTWVDQTRQFVSDQVNVWVEVLGGSIQQRAEALAARGGNAYKGTVPKTGARRAAGYRRSQSWFARAHGRDRNRDITLSEGPDGLGSAKPRLVIEVVNVDTFSSRQQHGSGTKADLLLDAVRRYSPELVVVDEIHKIRSSNSNVSRLIGRIGERVPRKIGLTGTVMPTSPLDVFGQWRFLDPYAFGQVEADGTRRRATLGQFRDRYAVLGGYMGREVTGFRNLDEMQSIISQRATVAKKETELDLPEVTEVTVPVHLTQKESDAYEDMKRNLRASLSSDSSMEATVGSRLTQMLRLRQVTSGHLPDDNGIVHALGHSKINTIDGIVNDSLAGESRIVIFCVFTYEIRELAAKLARKGTEVMVAYGATPQQERVKLRQRFGSDDPSRMVFVAQIQTMSLAVNEFVTASHAIFGSLSQQREELIQAQDRLHRIGQKRNVTLWYALAPSTVDDVIIQSHRDRSDLEQNMLQHIWQGE